MKGNIDTSGGTPISTKHSLESSWTWQESMKLDQSQTSTPRQDINWDAGGKRVGERFFLPRQSRYTRTRKILNELPTFYRSNFFLHVLFFFFSFPFTSHSFLSFSCIRHALYFFVSSKNTEFQFPSHDIQLFNIVVNFHGKIRNALHSPVYIVTYSFSFYYFI